MGNDEDCAPSEPGPGTFHTSFSEAEPPSVVIPRSLAALEDVEPTHLDPLAESIEPDALDTLFRKSEDGKKDAIVTKFKVCGYCVTVRDDGSITIEEAKDSQ